MRFLADEGVDAAIVSALRSDGHDIQWMAEEVRVDGIANERKGWIVAQAIGKYHTQLAGAFTVIQHATIRIRGM